jgi:D-cysteine desulfhydrase family pyridoxal phosphate-dependent enzyme
MVPIRVFQRPFRLELASEANVVTRNVQPRAKIAILPTPLVEAQGLRIALGGPRHCPRILIKRDDLTGVAFGGGKARKLEFLIADALQEKATVVVTSGPLQSNCAAMTAAVAPRFGMRSALVLSSRTLAPPIEGNVVLAQIFGASVYLAPASSDRSLAVPEDNSQNVERVVAALRQMGERPYVIPPGGSSAIGALGYVYATRELMDQLAMMGWHADRLYYASGSRGTQAGLELGSRLFGASFKLCGIAISGGERMKQIRAAALVNDASRLLGSLVNVSAPELVTAEDHLGPGYGISTEESTEAASLVAKHEGILLDPVYTAKAMAALINDIRRDRVGSTETVVFLHTGGTAAIFAEGYRTAQPLQFKVLPL